MVMVLLSYEPPVLPATTIVAVAARFPLAAFTQLAPTSSYVRSVYPSMSKPYPSSQDLVMAEIFNLKSLGNV